MWIASSWPTNWTRSSLQVRRAVIDNYDRVGLVNCRLPGSLYTPFAARLQIYADVKLQRCIQGNYDTRLRTSAPQPWIESDRLETEGDPSEILMRWV